MEEALRRFIVEPFINFGREALDFLPNLLAALLLVAGGVVLAWLARFILHRALAAVGLDRSAGRWGINDLLARWGVKAPFTVILGDVAFWVIILMFSIIALKALRIPDVDMLLSRFFLFLPAFATALFVVVAGYIISNFLSRASLVWAVNSGLGMAGLISRAVRLVVMLIALTMAAEQVGIGHTTILVVFSIIFAGVVFGFALAFGLGGREIAREFMEKRMREREKEKEDRIEHL